ncbi:MAG: hypothetical protein IT329_22735 [Caldilineaceae bacterium]|nr:hypothetical protein [Caldilineaceae bacterium]
MYPPPAAPAAVLWSAFRAGSLAAVALRSSRHSLTGAVLVCAFRSPAVAGAFAARWAWRAGLRFCAVRRVHGRSGILFAVSVPVAAELVADYLDVIPCPSPVRRLPARRSPSGFGFVSACAGGVRGVAAVARALSALIL